MSELCSCPSYPFIFPPRWAPPPRSDGRSCCWPCRCDCLDLTPLSFELQRMSQRHGPHQGARVGRGRWHQITSEAAFQTWIRRLLGPDNHRGPHAQRGNGCLVQSRYVPFVFLTCSHNGFDIVDLMWMSGFFCCQDTIHKFMFVLSSFQVHKSRIITKTLNYRNCDETTNQSRRFINGSKGVIQL